MVEPAREQGPATAPDSIVEALHRFEAAEATAFTFVDYAASRHGERRSLSWSQLDQRARAVGARLASVAKPGSRVAVLCQQNLDYVTGFFGALYAGMIAVPLSAPESGTNGQRLVSALADADPEVWLTSGTNRGDVRAFRDCEPVPRPKQLIAVDEVHDAGAFAPVPATLAQPAYVQYTSGSTRAPAGAVITHGAVLANVRQIAHAYELDSAMTCAGWIPFFHDMGLVQLVCLPVYLGCQSVFMTPAAFIRRPSRWLSLLSEHTNVMTAAPNFAFDHTINRLSEQDRKHLDLSGVRVAINGSEPVRATTIDRFRAATASLGFDPAAHRPSYGLAEATVFVTTTPARKPPRVVRVDREALNAGSVVPAAGDKPAVSLVSAGKPVGQRIVVVDPESGHVRPSDTVGEVWVHGPNVADGYWRSPEASQRVFHGSPSGVPAGTPGSGWLRTGDLGVIHDGELFITGRLKDLIIIDGKNHYPQDLEATVQEADPAIRPGRVAVFSVERDGAEGAVAVAEVSLPAVDHFDRAATGARIRSTVNRSHDVRLLDLLLVNGGTVSRTSSGKIARSATRENYLAGALTEREAV